MYAKDRGFFRKQGLNVKIKVLTDPTQTAAAVLRQCSVFGSQRRRPREHKVHDLPVRVVAGGALFDPGADTKTSALVAMPAKKITSARDLVGKRIAIDQENTIAHIGVLKWLKENGVERDQVKFTTLPFAQMLGPLLKGDFDAALLPEPFLTIAEGKGARRVAYPFDAVCTKECLLTTWIARKDMDSDVAARYRKGIEAAAVWANDRSNDAESAKILAKYTPAEPALLAKIKRTTFATRARAHAGPAVDRHVRRVRCDPGRLPRRRPRQVVTGPSSRASATASSRDRSRPTDRPCSNSSSE